MQPCLISFGANMGDPLETIQRASQRLQERILGQAGVEFRLSRFYRTPPVGGPGGQPPFVNAVAAFKTPLSPWDIWAIVRELEKEFGRFRNQRWEARRLDLDILLYGQSRIWTPHLKIPHPRMCMRRFMLIPAAEVAGAWIEPVTGQTIQSLASRLDGSPGSLTVYSASPTAKVILEEAARSALACWSLKGTAQPTMDEKLTRWIEFVAFDQPQHLFANSKARSPESKLTVLLAESTNQDGAWEDIHASYARWLRLTEGNPVESREECWKAPHPRYLLTDEDPEWASHELVAALEAMDCPVEALPDSLQIKTD